MAQSTALVVLVIGLTCLWLSFNLDRAIQRRQARRRNMEHFRYGPRPGQW